jgi:hypothetical protein
MPDVSILEPLNSSTVSGVTPIVADASDNVDVVGVRFKLDGANLQAEVTSEPYSISWDPTTTTSGPHTLTAVARDAAGNSIASASVAVIVPDITNPTVSITSPDEGSTSGIISVRAVASDNATVAGVQFKLDGLNLLLEDTVAPYSITWDTNTASVGSHILTAVAKDSSGNTTTSLPVAINLINAGFGSVQAVLIDSTYGVMPSTNWTIDTGTSNSSGDTLSSVSAVRHTVHVTKLPGFSVLVDWCTYTGSECTLSADAGYSASDLGLGCFGTDCTLQVTVPINQTIKLAFKYVPLQAALARCALGYHMRTLIAANIYSTPSASGVPIGTQASNKHTLIQADPAVGAPTVPYLADGLWWCYGNFDDAVDGWVVDSYLIRSVAPRYESL